MFLPSGCEAFMYIHEQETSWPQRLRVTGFAWFWASDGNTEKFTHLISIHEHLVPPHTPIPWLYCTVEVDGGKESSKEPNSHPSPPQAWKASAKIGNFVLHRAAASIYADYNGFPLWQSFTDEGGRLFGNFSKPQSRTSQLSIGMLWIHFTTWRL